jgi:hypothetical protein
MSRLSRLSSVLVVAVLAGSLLTAPATAAPPSYRSTASLQRPAVGECHDLSGKQLLKETDRSAPVDCAGPHTTQSVAVVTKPRRIGWGDTGAIERFLGRSCYDDYLAALGGSARTVAMTSHNVAYFYPSRADRRDGARWIRCDAVILTAKALRPLPSPLALTTPPSDGVATCLTRRYRLTVCSAAHEYRAVTTVRVRGKRFPGTRALVRVGLRKCSGKVPRGPYAVTTPSPLKWAAGAKFIVCHAQDRS